MKKYSVLNENTKRLLAYSSAAGLGAFVADQSAEADVFRGSDLGFMPFTLAAPGSQYFTNTTSFLDVDNDMANDFRFSVYANPVNSSDAVRIDSINTNASVQILTSAGTSYGSSSAPVGAFLLNESVSSSSQPVAISNYGFSPWVASRVSADINNDFPAEFNNYLGVRGSSGSYAWVRLQINMDTLTEPSITVNEYAYESNVGAAITIPEPSTLGLGLLALGALGMNVRRHRNKAC